MSGASEQLVDVSLQQIMQQNTAHANAIAEHRNQAAKQQFEIVCHNRAQYWSQVQQPRPIPPKMVRAVVEFDKENWPIRFEQTDVSVSILDPDSLLPVLKSDVGAVGGPVGAPIPDADTDPGKGKFSCSSTDTYGGGTVWTSPDGRKFLKKVEGFAGTRRYWLELK